MDRRQPGRLRGLARGVHLLQLRALHRLRVAPLAERLQALDVALRHRDAGRSHLGGREDLLDRLRQRGEGQGGGEAGGHQARRGGSAPPPAAQRRGAAEVREAPQHGAPAGPLGRLLGLEAAQRPLDVDGGGRHRHHRQRLPGVLGNGREPQLALGAGVVVRAVSLDQRVGLVVQATESPLRQVCHRSSPSSGHTRRAAGACRPGWRRRPARRRPPHS